MKTIKQILESHNIKEDTKFHNHSYLYKSIVKAMEEFGKQSYITGEENGSNMGYLEGFHCGFESSSNDFDDIEQINISFEDYLKQLENEES